MTIVPQMGLDGGESPLVMIITIVMMIMMIMVMTMMIVRMIVAIFVVAKVDNCTADGIE